MHPSVFPEDSVYCPTDQHGVAKIHPHKFLHNSSLAKDASYQDFMLCPVQVLEYKIAGE